MQSYEWSLEKNEWLKTERDISFEEVEDAIESGRLLDIIDNPNQKQHPNQRIFIVNINNYTYIVPFVENDEKVFFKTVIPSRKMTKKYLYERRES